MENSAKYKEAIQRFEMLKKMKVIHFDLEPEFDSIVRMACSVCATPIGFVTFIDNDITYFKSLSGINCEIVPQNFSVYQEASIENSILEVQDVLLTPYFSDYPLHCGEHEIRFIVNIPLEFEENIRLGTLTICDVEPRALTVIQKELLIVLAKQIVLLIKQREQKINQEKSQQIFENLFGLSYLVAIIDEEDKFTRVSPSFCNLLGLFESEVLGYSVSDFIHPDDIEFTKTKMLELRTENSVIRYNNRCLTKDGESITLN